MNQETTAVTMLLLTYNSDWNRVRLTLQGILKQEYQDYEIVIADDGSKDNLHEQLISYFKEHNFERYTLVGNKENHGTVKNILSGLAQAKGKYVKPVGAGDLFYNSHSLGNMVAFMEKTGAEGAVGLLRAFVEEDGHYRGVYYESPFDIEAYRKNDREKIKRNLLVYSDNVSGAGMFCKTEYYKEYLEKIQNYVIYEEDIFQVMAALDDRGFVLFDDYFVWYESNIGVSTAKDSPFGKKLAADVDRFYRFIIKEYADNKWVQKRKKIMKYYKVDNLYLRTILKTFEDPAQIGYLLSHYQQRAKHATEKKNPEKGFLQEKSFLREYRKS
jgi:glycosyltransferase involved in cell wall biosynthesis